MRKILHHLINSFNCQHVRVTALDGPGPGGASHEYLVTVHSPAEDKALEPLQLSFQNGALLVSGVNGLTDEALLAVLIDRLEGFQSDKYACRENDKALTHMQEAMHWLQHRAREREFRGVEGTMRV